VASVASALSRTRTFRAPFRLNQRRVVSVALMLTAGLGGFAYVNGAGQVPTYAVLVAARELPRGAVVGTGDLQPQRVALPEAMAAAALPSSALPEVVGQRLVEPLHAGVPVLRAQLAGPADLVPGYQRIAFPSDADGPPIVLLVGLAGYESPGSRSHH
jgi:flagella basal body P-ring formation protein FlgA